MTQDRALSILNGTYSTVPSQVVIRGTLYVFGDPLRVSLPVRDGPGRLADLVPIARRLSDALAERCIAHARRRGTPVPCKKGCCACCRYLVPLSAPEAFRLWDEIQLLPTSRREDVLRSFASSAERIRQRPPPIASAAAAHADGEGLGNSIGQWYAQLGLDCPLLADRICRFYPRRPLACRNYFVVSAPEHCRGAASALREHLQTPFSLVQALCRLTAEIEHTGPQAVLLPLVPAWVMTHLPRARRTWPMPELTERLLGIVQEMAEQAELAAAPA